MAYHMPLFTPLTREATLAQQVGQRIQAMLVERKLKPNDRLPSERELADQFGVSRTVVREAVKGLAAKGLLTVGVGRGGTTVRAPSAASMTEIMTLFLRGEHQALDTRHLIEARQVLEVSIAGLAAERRSAADLTAMRAILEKTKDIADVTSFVTWDLAFHNALAQATHNPVFPLFLDSINELMIEVRRLGYQTSGAATRTYRYHHAIFVEVERGDADAARHAMHRHLLESARTLRKALTHTPA
jgi:GntR family transcriptional regulator, transcriptional repressor for pyruvate dehydrogenase complex